MSDEATSGEDVPRGQKFFDNWPLLLILSLLLSGLLYNAWGLIEILTAPPVP